MLKLLIIQLTISSRAFELEKRYCPFWKWQNLIFKMMYTTHALGNNYGFKRPKYAYCNEKSRHFGLYNP